MPGLWVTEGVNEFVKRAILFDLVTYGRVGVSAYKLDEVLFFYANGRLGEPNSEESWQKLGARVIHNDPGKQSTIFHTGEHLIFELISSLIKYN